jgi:hypothetical protein
LKKAPPRTPPQKLSLWAITVYFAIKSYRHREKFLKEAWRKLFSKKRSPKKEKYHPCPFAAVSPKG